MISRLISVAALTAALTSSAALAQSYSYKPAGPPSLGGGDTVLGPGPLNEAAGTTTTSGAKLPQGNAPTITAQSDTMTPSGDTGAIGVSEPAVPYEVSQPPAAYEPSGETSSIGTEPVTQVPDPRRVLEGATVKSANGTTIGTVASVITDRHGSPQKLNVALSENITVRRGGSRTLGLAARDMRYRSNGHVVLSELTDQEMWSLGRAHSHHDH